MDATIYFGPLKSMTLLVAALLLAAPQDIPRLSSPVEDRAGALTPGQAEEGRALSHSLERSDSTQLVLLLVRTTEGKEIKEYALEVGRQNGVGEKGKNNGVVIVVAVDDRKVAIMPGYGLEGRLPDALASRIIRDEMVPRFKAGDYGGGSIAGMKAVAAAVKGEYKGNPTASTRVRKRTFGWGTLVLFIILAMLFSRRGGMGGFFTGYLIGGMMSGGGGRGSWGGGGGGGGWSGGGGSFGGGGASGSW